MSVLKALEEQLRRLKLRQIARRQDRHNRTFDYLNGRRGCDIRISKTHFHGELLDKSPHLNLLVSDDF
jgi:hypothetical protein